MTLEIVSDLHVHLGFTERERRRPQRVELMVELHEPTESPTTQQRDGGDVLSFSDRSSQLSRFSSTPAPRGSFSLEESTSLFCSSVHEDLESEFHTIEFLASRIAVKVLLAYPSYSGVRVHVAKPEAYAPLANGRKPVGAVQFSYFLENPSIGSCPCAQFSQLSLLKISLYPDLVKDLVSGTPVLNLHLLYPQDPVACVTDRPCDVYLDHREVYGLIRDFATFDCPKRSSSRQNHNGLRSTDPRLSSDAFFRTLSRKLFEAFPVEHIVLQCEVDNSASRRTADPPLGLRSTQYCSMRGEYPGIPEVDNSKIITRVNVRRGRIEYMPRDRYELFCRVMDPMSDPHHDLGNPTQP